MKKSNEASKCSPKQKYADILSALNILITNLPIELITVHVKGHQDDQVGYKNLDRLSQLNVDVDYEAKRALKVLASMTNSWENYNLHPSSFRVAFISGILVYHMFSRQAYQFGSDKRLLQHWIN